MRSRKKASVTIMDVAREAGTSYGTVSRVLNNNANVADDTRKRVQEAVERLGYVPNQQARSLVGGQSQVIGLLVPGLDNGYLSAVVRGIDIEIAKAGYDLLLYTTHRSKEKEISYVRNIVQGLAEGLIVLLPTNTEAYLEALAEQEFPYVFVDHEGIDDNSPSITVTNWQGAYDATTYLIELGHTRIGHITGRMELASGRDRLAGYQSALQERDIPYDAALVEEGDYLTPSGYAGARKLLALKDRPTAIFASNDSEAFGVMDAVLDCGLSIPEDISIVGFDDVPQASLVRPRLTTVKMPLEEMGRMATRTLLEHINDAERPGRRITLATELIIRDSCQSRR
jgi:LacI family transcriptional regulator